jgi:hypothetical protein
MMKKLISLILLISCIVLLAGCIETPTTPQRLYDIGREYIIGDTLKFKIENDAENERFIVIYEDINGTNKERYFNFYFHDFNSASRLFEPSYFEYSDNLGSEIVFNDDWHYDFIGDRTFYVVYKNSPEEIKTAIANSEYSILCYGRVYYVQD